MVKAHDLTGKVFGKLTVVERIGSNSKGSIEWKCQCDCGGETIATTRGLNSGSNKSCGCLKKVNKYREDITGQVFERLTVLEYLGRNPKSNASMYRCKCECGKEIITRKSALKNGSTKSCGCLTRFSAGEKATHGMSDTPIYNVWKAMKRRCESPNDRAYENYGGRGIKLCEEWKDFSAFYRDMGDTYKEGLTLERKDVNGNYTPENCLWATRRAQQNNRRVNHYINVFGEKLSLAQAARKYNIHESTLYHRIDRGMPPEDAVTLPVKNTRGEKK